MPALKNPKPKREKPLINSLTPYFVRKYEGWLDRGETESEKMAKTIPVEKDKIIQFDSWQH